MKETHGLPDGIDATVCAHNHALGAAHDGVLCLDHDLRTPRVILEGPGLRTLLDLSRPVALLVISVFHFIAEAEEIMDALRPALAPGSYIAALFGGEGLVEPGLVPVGEWGADEPPTHGKILGGVARVGGAVSSHGGGARRP